MSVFDERPASLPSPKRLRLLWLPALVVLAGGVFTAAYQPDHLRRSLQEFRGEAPADPGPDRSMDSSLDIRRFLLFHPHPKLSAGQEAALVASAAGPPDDQAQSEALDVLGLAQRASALSPQQARDALFAALRALRGSPGPMTRLEGARLLGHLRSPGGASALQALRHDSDPKVQLAAREALAQLPE